METTAREIVAALDEKDSRRFKRAVRQFLNDKAIKTIDVLQPSTSDTNRPNRDKADDAVTSLDKYECRLMAALSKQQCEDGTGRDWRIPHVQECGELRRWLTTKLRGSDGWSLGDKLNRKRLQYLVVRWRFWLALFSVDSSIQSFAESLEPAFGNPGKVQNGPLNLVCKAKAAVNEAMLLLGLTLSETALSNPLKRPAPEHEVANSKERAPGHRSGRKRAKRSADPTQGLQVINSRSPVLSSGLTEAHAGYDLYIDTHFAPDANGHSVILDTGCTHSIISLSFLRENLPNAQIRRFPLPFLIHGVFGSDVVKEFAILDIYLRAQHPISGKILMAKLTHDFKIHGKSSADMLIGQDVIKHHGFVTDNIQDRVIIRSCEGVEARIFSQPCELSPVVDETFDLERETDRLEQIARETHEAFLGA
ncbi:hypothetical protein LTR36_002567 [Oleoguttula mirabilis]|uniref:Peptidase A2 domain-containing protein n=1 Tax=Oleoguttula mirabilis TaxID=1507867 RepID=A0AAV9JL56_9PEZI|nr:hypothetical protein LTR36_002567 [Oleoguttula mirabilis]